MKIMTILGTRPEIIRLSRIIPLLDAHGDHVLVHTGQNYDHTLNGVFFDELGLRAPDHVLECKASSAMGQVGQILARCEQVMMQERPDRLLILGDTNSALAGMVAKRMDIPVYHMEAGNRCYDDRVPEEINRRVIDHCSDVLMPYTERSRANLLREGIAGERVFVTGNPISEVLEYYKEPIAQSRVLERLQLDTGRYFLVTLHRAENVDDIQRLSRFLDALELLHQEYRWPVIFSTHPRTRSKLEQSGRQTEGRGIHFVAPFGLFDFVHLEKHAGCVLSDSGTVQEECCIFHIPSVTLRDVTERPETVEAGSNILSGAEPERILQCVRLVMSVTPVWQVPPEYMAANVSHTVTKILGGFR